MDDGAASVWRDLAPELTERGMLTADTGTLLAVYVDAVARHREAAEIVARDGMLIVGDKEQVVRNPAVGLVKEYASVMVSAGRRFGL
jgi:P27 family predicted phage terminase small subunit